MTFAFEVRNFSSKHKPFMTSTNLLMTALLVSFVAFASYSQVSPEESLPQTEENVGITPIQAGNWIVGGNIGSLGYNFSTESFNANINPRVGFFILDNIAVGVGAVVGLTTLENEDNIWSYGLVPFARYYFPEGASPTGRFFGELEAGVSGSTGTSDASFLGGVRAGYAHFITNSVAIEGTFGYTFSKANISSGSTVTGLGIGLGFQIYLPGSINP
jgi:hypothetical protein